MQRCKVKLTIASHIEINFDEEEIDTLDELIDQIEDGDVPRWIKQQIKDHLLFSEVEIQDKTLSEEMFGPEDELDFD